ncbi:hypothetical protein B0H14DRAFT_2637444 [Mycena olivaceomarginata]|nr:hypothetical protein B0H14DRAFT_2637444 [Mycena olivaceomarginata]
MTRCSSPVPWIAPNSDGQVYSAWPLCTSDVRVSIKLQKLVKVPQGLRPGVIACAVDCAELWRPGWKANIRVISHRRMIVSTVHIRHLSRFDPQGRQAVGKRDKTCFVCPHGVYENYVCTCLRDEGTEHAPPLRERAVSNNPHLQDWLGGLVASSTTRIGNLAFSDPQLETSRSSNAIQGRGLPPPLSTLYVSKLRRLRHTRVDPHLRLKEQYHSRAAVLRSCFPPQPGPTLLGAHGSRGPSGSYLALAMKLSKLDPLPAQPQFPLLAIHPAIAIASFLEIGTRCALALPGCSRWIVGSLSPVHYIGLETKSRVQENRNVNESLSAV